MSTILQAIHNNKSTDCFVLTHSATLLEYIQDKEAA